MVKIKFIIFLPPTHPASIHFINWESHLQKRLPSLPLPLPPKPTGKHSPRISKILQIHHLFSNLTTTNLGSTIFSHLISPDLPNGLLTSFSLFRNILYPITRAFSLNNDLIRSLARLKLSMAPCACRMKQSYLSSQSRSYFKERERERKSEQIPATSPSELLGGSNKNVCRCTFKAIKDYPVVLSLYGGHSPLDESDISCGVFSKTQTSASTCRYTSASSFKASVDAQRQSRLRPYWGIYYFHVGTQN